jgi:hypothetical protein
LYVCFTMHKPDVGCKDCSVVGLVTGTDQRRQCVHVQ